MLKELCCSLIIYVIIIVFNCIYCVCATWVPHEFHGKQVKARGQFQEWFLPSIIWGWKTNSGCLAWHQTCWAISLTSSVLFLTNLWSMYEWVWNGCPYAQNNIETLHRWWGNSTGHGILKGFLKKQYPTENKCDCVIFFKKLCPKGKEQLFVLIQDFRI